MKPLRAALLLLLLAAPSCAPASAPSKSPEPTEQPSARTPKTTSAPVAPANPPGTPAQTAKAKKKNVVAAPPPSATASATASSAPPPPRQLSPDWRTASDAPAFEVKLISVKGSRMGPIRDDLTAVQFQAVVEYRNGSRPRPVKPMPFEFSTPSGKVLRYVDFVFSWIRVHEDNGLRRKGEPFDSRLEAHEVVQLILRTPLLRPPHPLARYTQSLVFAQEFKTPSVGEKIQIKSKPFQITRWY